MPPPPDLAAATDPADAAHAAATAFITRWSGVQASELATAQSFVIELCELLGVAKPHPTPEQDYMFERPVTFAHGDGSTSAGRIDCYRRGCFVLEAKKLQAATHTKGFDDGLLRARSQAEGYARALPALEGRPPFLIVLDVGNVIELYAEFSQSGATYTPSRPAQPPHRAGRAGPPRRAPTPGPNLARPGQPQPRAHQRPGHARGGGPAGATGQVA
ncbi:MAG: type IIL restriction-modification enzyme MmeI [Burkholderiaceae bacterium]